MDESRRYQVVVSEDAAHMLVSHTRFSARVSEPAAGRLVRVFREKVKSRAQYPERNPWLVDSMLAVGKYRKLLLEKRYLIVCQVGHDTVYVDAVVDTRQDYGRWL